MPLIGGEFGQFSAPDYLLLFQFPQSGKDWMIIFKNCLVIVINFLNEKNQWKFKLKSF